MRATFDSRKFARGLRDKADLTDELAEGIAEAFSEAADEHFATEEDLAARSAELRGEVASLRAQFRILKWMSGVTLALLVAVLAKLLLH
jgi:hypothetical protein